ncbi:hypothetical protein [Caballeronia grimmiae]|uniref:hypothetical protein n=1 Tax=Caballeronia grimmiae TaxID=1071679 RepID=UPI0038BA169A
MKNVRDIVLLSISLCAIALNANASSVTKKDFNLWFADAARIEGEMEGCHDMTGRDSMVDIQETNKLRRRVIGRAEALGYDPSSAIDLYERKAASTRSTSGDGKTSYAYLAKMNDEDIVKDVRLRERICHGVADELKSALDRFQ